VIAYFYGMFSLHSRNRGYWSLSLSLTCTRVIPPYCILDDDEEDVVAVALRSCYFELNSDALGTR
jgi:hypothetical protein